MKNILLISFLFMSFSILSQEVETNINNSNYKKNSSEIKLLNEKIDEMNSNREKIVIRNRGLVMRDEDLKQITIIDPKIDELKLSLKVLK